MKLGQDMSSFIATVKAMAAQFNDMGQPTTENVVISKILCSLPIGLSPCNICLE
jgi:hypothetical protein